MRRLARRAAPSHPSFSSAAAPPSSSGRRFPVPPRLAGTERRRGPSRGRRRGLGRVGWGRRCASAAGLVGRAEASPAEGSQCLAWEWAPAGGRAQGPVAAGRGWRPSSSSSPGGGGGLSMFRWLEVLEKEFDKAFVDVDLLLGEIDPDQADITYEGRQKMTSLSSCFAQLCHKAQTVYQINHKLEAQLVDMKSELTETQAEKAVLEKEVHDQLLQLHAIQLQLHAKTGQSVDSGTIKAKLSAPSVEDMERELEANKKEKVKEAQLEAEVKLLRKENEALRRHIAVLQAEVYGARLAAKYLDKELAGRVQQIQLLGRDMKGPAHDKLWNQLEAEIHLHRHKTVIRACRGRNDLKRPMQVPPGHDPDSLKKSQGVGPIRKVLLVKEDHEGLGISITRGEIEFEVVYVAPEVDSDDENVEYEDESGHRYRLYLDELEEGGNSASNRKSGCGDVKQLQVFDKKASIDGHENGDLGNSVETEETISKLDQSAESLA
uniref:Golgi associated PDZ and coiled-coil motif containing n=1 Tax=Podarcis muralis TaxID=64176 RepID=A0A670ICB2_PODMU